MRERSARPWRVAAVVLAIAVAPAGSSAAATRAARTTLSVTAQSFAVSAGDDLTLTTAFSGPSAGADTTFVVRSHAAITEPGAVAAALAEPGAVVDSFSVPAATAVTDDSGETTITAPTALGQATAGDAVLQFPDAGVHPISITATTPDGAVASAATVMLLVDPDGTRPPSLDVAVLAGIEDPGPWSTDLTSPVESLRALVDVSARVDGPLSVQLPPSVASLVSPPPPPAPDGSLLPDVAADVTTPVDDARDTTAGTGSLPATGSMPDVTTPDATPELEAPLAEAFDGDLLLTRPFVAVDPSSLVAVGEGDLLAGQLRVGEDVLGATVPLADNSREAWVTGTPISEAGASALRTLGVRLLVVAPDVAESLGVSVDPFGGAAFDVVLANDETMTAVAVSPLGASLGTPDEGVTASSTAARIVAELALVAAVVDPGAVVLGAPNDSLPDAEVTGLVAEYLGEVPGADLVPLSSLTNRVAQAAAGPPVTLPAEAGDDLSGRVALIDSERSDSGSAESMLVDPARARHWESEFDAMLSSAVTDAEVGEHLTAVAAEVDSILGAIVAPEPSTLTLTGSSNTLRFDVGNTSAYDLEVLVRVRSAKLTFENSDTPATIPAGQTAAIAIPAEARSNGSFSVELTIHAPDLHHRVAGPVVFRADVTRLGGLSQVVTAGALIALASWWYSHFRKSRAARRAAAAGDADDAGISGPLEP